jgi:hypothetical protein
MSADVFEFSWLVPQAGYHWLQAQIYRNDGPNPRAMTERSRLDDEPQWVLTKGITIGQEFRQKRYAPLKDFPALFRTLAGIATADREAILSFANRFGYLGIDRPYHIPGSSRTALPVFGETHEEWVEQVDELRRALVIWDLLKAGDKPGLARCIRWRERQVMPDGIGVVNHGGWIYDSHPDLPVGKPVPSPGRTEELIEPVPELFRPEDVAMPALFLVQRWINKHLAGKVTPRLLYNLDTGQQVLQVVPATLLSAAWLQFAQAIAGNRQHRTCKECGGWFEVSVRDEGRTARRLFCSDPCKSRDYRRNKKMAQDLKSAGKLVPGAAAAKNRKTIEKSIKRRKK